MSGLKTHTSRVRTLLTTLFTRDLYLGADDRQLLQGLNSTPYAAANVTGVKLARGYQLERLTLAATAIEIDEANDYGSAKLTTLPVSNVIILGAMAELVLTVDGTVITDPEDIDWALGTTALTSTDFSNAGEKNIITEADVAALGVMNKATATAEANVALAKGANSVYLNIQATIATTAIQTISGTLDLFYIDLGAQA
ncbi:MAG: hypothetical protein DRO67_09175 [Candidatus Asgardarchaeum californiense]|nr:MAG: hypothetical protein DRO67_09175 [Candidatus Asgardarchaeum californiense]